MLGRFSGSNLSPLVDWSFSERDIGNAMSGLKIDVTKVWALMGTVSRLSHAGQESNRE